MEKDIIKKIKKEEIMGNKKDYIIYIELISSINTDIKVYESLKNNFTDLLSDYNEKNLKENIMSNNS